MKRPNPSSPNMNYAWAEVTIRELTRLGVSAFFVAPGSRSSPLAWSAAEYAPDLVVHFDERGLGFAALGHARATGRPAVVITTSGSAVANLLPAACEAAADYVPMILLTADRPPELRASGANQTMDQVGIFSSHLRWHMDLPCPDVRIPGTYLLSTLDEAYARATGVHSGPVHLNQMLREPLAPVVAADQSDAWRNALGGWWKSDQPWTRRPAVSAVADIGGTLEAIRKSRHGLVVAGDLRNAADRQSVLALAARLGWPILPDIRSGLRLQAGHPEIMAMVDQLLLSDKARAALAPDLVLHCGGRVTSKRLQQFLASARTRYVQIHPWPERIDPDNLVTDRIQADIAPTLQAIRRRLSPAVRTNAWLRTWTRLHASVAAAWPPGDVTPGDHITEPMIASQVSRNIPRHHGLVLANSMAVRDMEMYGVATRHPPEVIGNRGVSGIDGNVATAAGYARGTGRPATLVIGDLALLHDLNSLALVGEARIPLTIVVVNNDGGAIFSFLPVAASPKHFERCFGTPHGRSFQHAATLFDIPYQRPETVGDFVTCYREAVASGQPNLIEVATRRGENVAEHRRIQDRLRKCVDHGP